MKTNRKSLAWALIALISLIASTLLSAAAIGTTAVRTSGLITKENVAEMMTFKVTDAPSGGSRYLIQATGFTDKTGRRFDPVLELYYENADGRLSLVTGNDDWKGPWSDGVYQHVPNPAKVESFAIASEALALNPLDSALAVKLNDGSYTIVVSGYAGTIGPVGIGLYRINEAPSPQMGHLPFAVVGEIPLARVYANDPDNDDVEFLFDMDGDGTVDLVSPRVRSGQAYWPTFFKFDSPGTKTFRVWSRDSRGAVSPPFISVIEIRGKP